MSQPDERTTSHLVLHLFAAAGFLAALALALVIWRLGPEGPVPVSMNMHGRVIGWSSRGHVALLVAVMTVVYAVCYGFMGALTGTSGRNLTIARLVVVLVAIMTAVIMTATTFGAFNGPGLGPSRLQPAILSLLFLVVGAVIGKASPNPLVGVRTYWALRSRLAWDKSNRLAGRLFFLIGVVGLAASAVAPPALVVAAVLIGIISTTAIAVFESWRVWRNDPERAAPRR